MAVHDGYIYWAGDTTIGRASINGGGVNQKFFSTTGEPGGVTVEGVLVPWKLKLTAAPASATIGTRLTITAATNNVLAGTPYDVNVYLDGKLFTKCKVNSGAVCQQSFDPAPDTTYEITADVGPAQTKPFTNQALVSRKLKVTVVRTRPTCVGTNCM
jgi:hypothetical protein